ncbi:MAG: hypothetical protein JSU70_00410 [Phycisphaerales bacterium]|nr:MAG: hypothetical protein JSU70_00410 [Phycisphaerales bacterium]
MKPICKRYFAMVGLTWAGSLVPCFFVYLLVLVPQKETKNQVEKQFVEAKQAYHSAVQAAQDETRTRLNDEIEELRHRLESFVIDFDSSANLTFDISEIAGQKEVTSFSIRGKDGHAALRATPECEHIGEHHMSISFTAGFNQFADLLNTLERNRPVVFVDEFTITRSDTDDSSHLVNMDAAVLVRKPRDS